MGSRRRIAGERARTRDERSPREPDQPVPVAPAVPFVAPEAAPVRPAPSGRPVASPFTTPPPDPAAGPARRSRVVVGVLWVALVLAVLVAGSLAVTTVVLDRREQAESDARTAATESARTAAELVLSYDHTTLDADFAAAQEVSTGDFAQEYAETSENVVRDLATQTEAVVEAEVVSAGVVSSDVDRVVVLLFVNQTTQSNRLDQPQTDQNRVRLTMVRTEGRWLVEQVEAL